MSACSLCPRRCGVNRTDGRKGYCGAGNRLEIFRYGPHHGEEPPVSGSRGSGTVFFSRCTLRCIYCQNYPWSQCGQGQEYTVDAFADALKKLADMGCHNWNLVSPTPWLPLISEAVTLARRNRVSLPIVYNTSGYERPEMLDRYGDLADIYLPDLRYSETASAKEGSDAGNYVVAARDALLAMWRRAGPLELDGNGVARKGVICRILVLPGRANEAVENLRWLADNLGDGVGISVMCQYTPAHLAPARPPWNRRVTAEEYGKVIDIFEKIGFANGWIQDYEETVPSELIGFKMKPGEDGNQQER